MKTFLDSSKRSFRSVPLHNKNEHVIVAVGHSVHLKEYNKSFDLILINLSDCKRVCDDLKVISILLNRVWAHKFPCLLCKWSSTDRKQNYVKKEWPIKKTLDPEVKNTERESLVTPLFFQKKVLFSLFHIKLALMKQFIALSKEGKCFKYLCDYFPGFFKSRLK